MRIRNAAFLNLDIRETNIFPNSVAYSFPVDDFNTSVESENAKDFILALCPNEVYNQFIILPEQHKNLLNFSINAITLVDSSGNFVANIPNGFKMFPQYDCLYLSFKIPTDYADKCLRLRIQFDTLQPNNTLFTNPFSVSAQNKERTVLVTYKHLDDYFGQPYSKEKNTLWSQIRLPFWYVRPKTEQDSFENLIDTKTQSNIQISRVQRRFLDVYRVTAPNWMNVRISALSDVDFIYFDSFRQSVRPFVFEKNLGGSELSISELESQEIDADRFLDDTGLTHFVIVINSIDSGCCDEAGTPIEPVISYNDIIANQCSGDGFRNRITINGQPNSVGKLQLRVTAIQGQAKNLLRVGGGFTETYGFNSVGQILNIYYFLNQAGISIIEFESCFEDCTPYAVKELQIDLELFRHDMTMLNGQVTSFGNSAICPAPIPAQWLIVNDNNTNDKDVQVIGATPNDIVKVLIECINMSGVGYGQINFGAYYVDISVIQGTSSIVTMPTDNNGDSPVINFVIHRPPFPLGSIMPMLVVKATILNSDGTVSNEILTLIDNV